MTTSVREMKASDIEDVVDYFLNATPDYLTGMGADPNKLPNRNEWVNAIKSQLNIPYKERSLFYVIWELDGKAVGHSNINKIVPNQEAYMHLHMWDIENRQNGLGPKFIGASIPNYFEKFNLKQLICEPFAKNKAPVNTIQQFGFEFIKTYETIPGVICFSQQVNRYLLTRENYQKVFSD